MEAIQGEGRGRASLPRMKETYLCPRKRTRRLRVMEEIGIVRLFHPPQNKNKTPEKKKIWMEYILYSKKRRERTIESSHVSAQDTIGEEIAGSSATSTSV